MNFNNDIKITILILPFLFLLFTKTYSQSSEVIVKDKFDATLVNEFGDGILISKNNKYGMVNYEMELKIPIKYRSITENYDYYELIIVERKNKFGVFNLELKELLECKYSYVENTNIGILVKSKKGVGVYNLDMDSFIIETKYDSIKILENQEYGYIDAYVYKKDKVGLYIYDYKLAKIFDCKWNNIDFMQKEISDVYGNDFYAYYMLKDKDSTSKNTVYNNKAERIIYEGYSSEAIGLMSQVNADSIDMDRINGDGLFKAKNIVSQKWGLYQGYGDTIIMKIPPHYDSLYYFGWNYPYTIVFNNGLAGIYLWDWTEVDDKPTVNCIYEDYKKVESSSGYYYYAGKIDGKWFWIDWFKNKKTRNMSWDTYEEMELSYYDRSSYYQR